MPKKCIVCDSLFFENYINRVRLKKCISCELIIGFNSISAGDLEKYYANPHYYDYWGSDIYHISTEDIKKSTFSNYFNKIDKLITKGKYLDIGCSVGFSLETAKKYGWQPYGIEVSPQIALIAKKKFPNNIFVGTLEKNVKKNVFKSPIFKLVSLFDTVEHFIDPLFSLKSIKNFLTPKGLLIMTTPDIESLSFKFMRNYWPHLLKEHLFYFSKKTVKKLLEKAGYKVEAIEPAIKYHNLNYAFHRFSKYPKPIITPTINTMHRFLPENLRLKSMPLCFGEMFIIASKI